MNFDFRELRGQEGTDRGRFDDADNILRKRPKNSVTDK